MDFKDKDYYGVLGINKDANIKDIESARDELKWGKKAPVSKWLIIDEAYEVLSNPITRKKYDQFLLYGDRLKPTENLFDKNEMSSFSKTNYETQNSNKLQDNTSKIDTNDLNIEKDTMEDLPEMTIYVEEKIESKPNVGLSDDITEEINLLKQSFDYLNEKINRSFEESSDINRIKRDINKYRKQAMILKEILEFKGSVKKNTEIELKSIKELLESAFSNLKHFDSEMSRVRVLR